MAATKGKGILVRLLTHIFFICTGLALAGCDPQGKPITSGTNIMPSQTESLTRDQNTNTADEIESNELLAAPDAIGDETSLLATETIDPEADETAVTIVVLPQKHDTDIETSRRISDAQTVADASSRAIAEQSDEALFAILKGKSLPDMLIGMTALEVKTKIGPADFIRKEGIVVTWQYRMPTCVIDLFISFDDATPSEDVGNARIDNMQISGTYIRSRIHGTSLKETECLSAFSERRQAAH